MLQIQSFVFFPHQTCMMKEAVNRCVCGWMSEWRYLGCVAVLCLFTMGVFLRDCWNAHKASMHTYNEVKSFLNIPTGAHVQRVEQTWICSHICLCVWADKIKAYTVFKCIVIPVSSMRFSVSSSFSWNCSFHLFHVTFSALIASIYTENRSLLVLASWYPSAPPPPFLRLLFLKKILPLEGKKIQNKCQTSLSFFLHLKLPVFSDFLAVIWSSKKNEKRAEQTEKSRKKRFGKKGRKLAGEYENNVRRERKNIQNLIKEILRKQTVF